MQLIEVVTRLAEELHPRRKGRLRAALDSALDRDLGFDSLSRVELLVRVERRFKVSLSSETLAAAETPRDLLNAIRNAQTLATPSARVRVAAPAPAASGEVPREAQTLADVLDWHCTMHPDRTHVVLCLEGDTEEAVTYRELREGASRVARGLLERGLEPGQRIAMMLPTGKAYLFGFFGVLLAGGVPVPIYPPVRRSQLEEHLRRHAGILSNALATFLVTVPEARVVAGLLRSRVASLRDVLTMAELSGTAGAGRLPSLRPTDTAFIQYTSGSTGSPKGVVLTHAHLLANIRAMGEATEANATDVFVSWLPLYHDMGLIGAWLGSLYYACPLILMSPLTFLARPQRWLWAIHRHRGTLSAAPNFAYELCLKKVRDEDIEGLDLSSWRMAFNGAEPVSPRTLDQFSARFARFGFRRQALAPVYGLAEAAVGLAFPPPERGPKIHHARRKAFIEDGEVVPAEPDDEHALAFVSCGRALPGYELRIVDRGGFELPDLREGRVQFRGPSATSGYFRNAEATRRLFDGRWLETGDMGFTMDGEVFLTGRAKEVIIRGGRNIYPYEVEQAVGDIPGVRKGCVAVFGAHDPGVATEKVVVLAETRETGSEQRLELERRIVETATDILGMPPDEVVLAPPHTVLKTSSGKIRRSASREFYEQGELGQTQRSVWWQLVRVGLGASGPWLRRQARRFGELAYAAYVWVIVALGSAVIIPLLALLPIENWRLRMVRMAARAMARAARIAIYVEGLEHIPTDKRSVLVSNHASYMDAITLTAALPPNLSFVAKAELGQGRFMRWALGRLGTELVERFDQMRSVEDAQRVAATVRADRSLVYFPEGTFTRNPGLLPFHLGAFVAAATTGAAIVPVCLRGTRFILRDRSWFPRRGVVRVTVNPPVLPTGDDWSAAVRLRDAAREVILQCLGEPDLAS